MEDEDDSDYEYFIDHPELEGFDFRVIDMEVGVPDPFKAQEEMIRFNWNLVIPLIIIIYVNALEILSDLH